MRGRLFATLFLLLPLPAAAQLTTVSGTIKGTDGVAYSGAQLKMQLVTTAGSPVSGQPTVTVSNQAQCVSGGFGSAPCQVPFQGTVGPFQISPTGTFTINLQDNTLVTPAATQWLFTANALGSPLPIGSGPQVCTAQFTISGPTQTVSIAGCPALSNVAVAPTVLQNGLLAEYRLLPTESLSSITDYSGNNNTGVGIGGAPLPTQLPTTGGFSVAGGFVLLPSAINSAKTIQVFVSTVLSPNASPQGMIVGVGSVNSPGLYLTTQPGSIGPVTFRLTSGCNQVVASRTKNAFGGIGLVSWVLDATVDRIYINQNEAGVYFTQAGPCAAFTPFAGSYQLGGSGSTCTLGSPCFFTGNIYYVAIYNRVLSAAEIAYNYGVISQIMSNRGVVAQLSGTIVNGQSLPGSTQPFMVADGDSITAGFGLSFPWSANLTLNLPAGTPAFNVYNQGLAGQFLTNMLLTGSLSVDTFFHPQAPRNVVTIWGGTNDITQGASAGSVWQGMAAYAQQRHAVGWKVLCVTMISRTGQDAGKNSFDTVIRANWAPYCDGLVDVASDPNLGADGANANATFFQADNIHPTQHSDFNIIAPMFNRAINRLYGAHDFNGASSYAAAAAAATATTAGTESTNTVTLTFGANPFAAGADIVCTGITPAGYNSPAGLGWYVLTSSGTQVTFFNPTTGLGAITVQGSCSQPQQLDGDQYYTVNFGAGNTTLETCRGFVGQNIYIRNINAAASTLVPFGTETITGPGTTTLAANSTAILQSQLVSSAAAGCNWIRVQ